MAETNPTTGLSRPVQNNAKSLILFDFGDTLVRYWTYEEGLSILKRALAGVHAYMAELRPALTLPEPSPNEIQEERRDAADYRVRPLERRLSRLFGLPGDALSSYEWHEACRAFLKPLTAVATIYPDTLPTLRTLRSAGYRLGILSNSPWGVPADLWRQEILRHIPAELIDYAGVCGDCGWRKPAPQPFQHALTHFAMASEACLFVGDHPDWDVEGARSAGLDALLLDRIGHHAASRYPWIGGLTELLELLDIREETGRSNVG